MRNIFLATLLLTVFLTQKVNSQIYSRSSITPIFINFKNGIDYRQTADSVKITDKYDYNYFGSNLISVSVDMVSPSQSKVDDLSQQISELRNLKEKDKSIYEQIQQLGTLLADAQKQLRVEDSIRNEKVKEAFFNSKIANKILSSLLVDESSKVMTLDVLAKRAEYNATDADFIKAMNSEAKMSAIRDNGLNLLKNVYIVLIDSKNRKEVNADEKNSNLKKILISGEAFLYHIDIDSLKRTGQFDNLIFTEPNQSKYNEFKNFNFPVNLVMTRSFSSSTQNYRVKSESTLNIAKSLLNVNSDKGIVNYEMLTEDEILKSAVNDIFESSQVAFTNDFAPFQVKVNVFESNPIRAKIGTKESLKIDALYKVTENVQGKNNEIVESKIGWVRVKKVADNKRSADGKTEPSEFYKTWSKNVEKGMKLSEKPEQGVIIGILYGTADKENIMHGPSISIDLITHMSPGLRAGINIGGFSRIEPNDVFLNGVSTPKTNLNFSGTNLYGDVNIQKIIGGNRFEFTPMLGAYFSALSIDKFYLKNIEYKTEDYEDLKGLNNTVYGALAGVKFGLNLGRNLQLNCGYKVGFQIGSNLTNEKNDKVTYDGVKVITMNFKNPATPFIGLRLFGF